MTTIADLVAQRVRQQAAPPSPLGLQAAQAAAPPSPLGIQAALAAQQQQAPPLDLQSLLSGQQGAPSPAPVLWPPQEQPSPLGLQAAQAANAAPNVAAAYPDIVNGILQYLAQMRGGQQ
jgi:hypothetical protein